MYGGDFCSFFRNASDFLFYFYYHYHHHHYYYYYYYC